MKRAAVFAVTLAAATTLVATTQLSAQNPNFTGTWAVIADAAAPAPGGGGGGRGGRGGGRGGLGLGMGATITQDASTLTVVRTTGAGEVRSVYRLDGSESRNTVQGRGGATAEQVSRARFDGGRLVITTQQDFGGNMVETTMALSLDGQGNLVVETTAPGRGGGAPNTTTMRYRKG
jgi:hypothetical protein